MLVPGPVIGQSRTIDDSDWLSIDFDAKISQRECQIRCWRFQEKYRFDVTVFVFCKKKLFTMGRIKHFAHVSPFALHWHW